MVLGGLRAFTPGHGKTLIADYLVGSRGTVRHAIALGAIVTFRHTASVMIAPFAGHWIMPDVLGIMIIAVGLNSIVLGLAAVLMAFGILLGSAALVTVLGISITFGGFAAYLH